MKKTNLLLLVALVFGASPAAANCTVRSGDSLHKIAERYNVDFKHLKELNKHLKDLNLIYPQQKIELPVDKGHGQTENKSKANDNNLTQSETAAAAEKATEILNLVNAARKENGLTPLKLDSKLCDVATVKAKDMGENNYFSHNSATYGSPFDLMHAFGVDYKSAGENIAAGQKTATQVMDDWLHSSGHRANILNKNYNTLGVGYYDSGTQAPYWVQEFTQQ